MFSPYKLQSCKNKPRFGFSKALEGPNFALIEGHAPSRRASYFPFSKVPIFFFFAQTQAPNLCRQLALRLWPTPRRQQGLKTSQRRERGKCPCLGSLHLKARAVFGGPSLSSASLRLLTPGPCPLRAPAHRSRRLRPVGVLGSACLKFHSPEGSAHRGP